MIEFCRWVNTFIEGRDSESKKAFTIIHCTFMLDRFVLIYNNDTTYKVKCFYMMHCIVDQDSYEQYSQILHTDETDYYFVQLSKKDFNKP